MNSKIITSRIAILTIIIGAAIFLIGISYIVALKRSLKVSTSTPLVNLSVSKDVYPQENIVNQEEDQLNRGLVSALNIYQSFQLTDNDRNLLKNFSWPELKPFKSEDANREIYLVDCQVTNDELGIKLVGHIKTIPNVKNVAEVTIKALLAGHYGGFPDSDEVSSYTKVSGLKFKTTDSGINGVLLKPDGTLIVNFYDSVRSYGGGSSRVGCLSAATRYTMLQFPTIKQVEMCIDQYPSKDGDCSMDFQP
jgi:hypothetical protein